MQMKLGKLLAETKTGEKRQIEPEKDGRGQKYEFELAGYHFFVKDMVKKTEESDEENQEYFITRRIVGKRKEASGKKEGIALSMYLEFGEETDIFRVGIPSAVYGAYVSREESTYHSFMEDRLTGVMLLLFDEDHKKSTVVQKMNPAKYIEKEERKRGEGRYLHKTETTSIGYGFGEATYVKLCWPYEEREKSVALDSMETPAQGVLSVGGGTDRTCFGIQGGTQRMQNLYGWSVSGISGTFAAACEERREDSALAFF